MRRKGTIALAVVAALALGVGGGCSAPGAPSDATPGEISVDNVQVGDTLEVNVTVKNTSPASLSTQGPAPGYTYEPGDSYLSPRFPPEPGRWRVAVGPAGLEPSDLPYRWGLGGNLGVGASTTVTGHIRLTPDLASRRFVAALVQEPPKMAHFSGRWGLIAATPAERAVVVVDEAHLYSSPSPLSIALTQVAYGTQVDVIVRSADWFRVRLPDEREGWLAADWVVPATS